MLRIPPLGSLRHFIKFQSIDEDSDESTWTDNGITAMASIEPVSGRLLQTTMQVQASRTHRITMLYQPGITAAMRIIFGTRVFAITEVLDQDERHRVLELSAEEAIPT